MGGGDLQRLTDRARRVPLLLADRRGVLGEVPLDHAELERGEDRPLRLALEQEPEAGVHQRDTGRETGAEPCPVTIGDRDLVFGP